MRTMIDIPAAVHIGRAGTWRPGFLCSICARFSLYGNRWTLAGVHVCKPCATDHNSDRFAAWEQYQRDVSDAYVENETFDRDAALYARREAINDMEKHCGTSYPDRDDTPGAQWLYQLHTAATEAWDAGRFGPDSGENESDVLSELSDGAVEIYTYPRWQIFMELCMWESEVEMFGGAPEDPSDLTETIGGIMHEVAYAGLSSWLSEKKQSAKCEECDEFPCECCDDCGEFACICADDTDSSEE